MTAASSGEARVCVLTGAASGIGRQLTGVLRAGFRVVATDKDLEKLEETARDDGWPGRSWACALGTKSAVAYL